MSNLPLSPQKNFHFSHLRSKKKKKSHKLQSVRKLRALRFASEARPYASKKRVKIDSLQNIFQVPLFGDSPCICTRNNACIHKAIDTWTNTRPYIMWYNTRSSVHTCTCVRVGEGREKGQRGRGRERGGKRRRWRMNEGGEHEGRGRWWEGGGGGARRKAAAKLLSGDVLTSSDAIDVESVRATEKTRQKDQAGSSAAWKKRTGECAHDLFARVSLPSLSLSFYLSRRTSRIEGSKEDPIIPGIRSGLS